MNEFINTLYVINDLFPIGQVVGTFVAVWLAARFAMYKFRSEKWWALQLEAYQEAYGIFLNISNISEDLSILEIMLITDPTDSEKHEEQIIKNEIMLSKEEDILNEFLEKKSIFMSANLLNAIKEYRGASFDRAFAFTGATNVTLSDKSRQTVKLIKKYHFIDLGIKDPAKRKGLTGWFGWLCFWKKKN